MAFHPRTSIIPHSQQQHHQQQQKQRSRKKEETDLFESLPDQEIVGCIKAIGISFTVADLQKPNPAHVQQIFEWFAEVLLNVTCKTVEPAMRTAAEDVCGEFAEMFPVDTLDLQGFHASLQKLLFVCGINDFSSNDLYKPTHDRLVKILSHLINFVRFREPLVKVIEEHSGKTESVKTRVETLYNENQEIENQLGELKRNRKAMEAQVREKTTRNEDLKRRLLDLRRYQEKITTRLEETKQKKGELTSLLEQTRLEKLALKQESAKLRPYVLQSPSALQESLAELRETLNNDKAHIDALERRARASQTTADSVAATTAAVASCVKVLEDIATELSKEEEAKVKNVKQRDALSEHGKRLCDLERAEAMLNRQLSMWIERRKNLCEQSEAREQEASGRMQELEVMRQKLTKETAERTREAERRRVRIEQIERKMNELRENIRNEVQTTRDEYLKMEAHVKLYISEMEQTID